jgi:hypothetical protein
VQNTPKTPKYIRKFGEIFEKIKNPYFSKIRSQNDQRFMAILMARLWRA